MKRDQKTSLRRKLPFVMITALVAAMAVSAGVDVTFDSANKKFITKNNTPIMIKLGGVRFETQGKANQDIVNNWQITGQSEYNEPGRRWYDIYLSGQWQSRVSGDEFEIDGWKLIDSDLPKNPEPLMKIGTCSEPAAYEDAEPYTLEQLAEVMKNPLYYSSTYRYIDSLGAKGGPFSGGWIDTWAGETQFQFAIPETTWTLHSTPTRFETVNTGAGPYLWMALSGYQELFGGDAQWLAAVGMQETCLLVDREYLGINDGTGYTPFEVETPTWISRMGGYVKYFPHQQCVQESTDGSLIPENCGYPTGMEALAGYDSVSAIYLGPTNGPSHTEKPWIVNEVFASGLVWWYNYDIMSAATNLGFREVLLNAREGGDPHIGICIMAVTYNRGINSGNPDLLKPKADGGRLEDILNNPQACDNVLASGFGNYTAVVRGSTKILVDASKRAYTDPRVKLIERDITLEQVKGFYFGEGGDIETYVAVLNGAHVSAMKGGLMMHFKISEEEARAMWSEVEQAFNMQAQKWGGNKISLRYDWLSNLRVAKKYLDRSRGQVGGYEATDWIKNRSKGDKDVSGRNLDTQYPFFNLLALQDDGGLTLHVSTRDSRQHDRGIARVEWTFNDDWTNFSPQGATWTTGSALEADYEIHLSNDILGRRLEEGGEVYVRVADSCGNAVVASAPIQGMKLPKITDAFILDTDGDGHGDRIVVMTSEDDDVTLHLSDATGLRYSWPTADNLLAGDRALIKKGSFNIDDKNLKGGAADGLGGRVEISWGSTTIRKTVRDSVGPVIRYASIQERYPKVLYINFSENITPISDVALQYLEIGGTAVSITAVEEVDKIWKFTLSEALDLGRVEKMLDSVRIVPGAIKDALGNGAVSNNIKVPIVLDKGPLEIADEGFRYLDQNIDGTMDRIELKFKQPAIGRTGTMTLTYRWPVVERTTTSTRYTVKEFKISGDKLAVDDQDPTIVTYDASGDSLRQNATWFDLNRDGWGKATILQKSLTPAIPDRTDELPMVDAMGPIAVAARYGETSYPDKRPDTLAVDFSEPIDTAATELFSSRLYLTKSGVLGEERKAHELPNVKKRYRNQTLSVYFEPQMTERPGIGDSLKIAYGKEEEGLIQDLAGNRAHPFNPWVLIDGKLRVQISAGDLFVMDGSEGIPKDTVLFFGSTYNLDSLTSIRAGIGFTISFLDSGDVKRDKQFFNYEMSIFSNLGGFVRKIAGVFSCKDLEASGNRYLANACDPARYAASQKVKVFVPWDYRSQKGQLVGSGAYIYKISVKGRNIETMETNRTFGIVRRSKGAQPWDLSK